MEEKDIKTRKELDQYKEGERLYAKFQQETAAQDQEYEKELDRMIEERMSQGLEDDKIIDQLVTGGSKSFTRKDLERAEQMKLEELKEQIMKDGDSPITPDHMRLMIG